MSETHNDYRRLDVHQELRIDAPRERVWQALTRELAQWWPKSFYVNPAPRGFVLEPRVGGRVYEDLGDGQGALWATVLGLEHGRSLQWVGDLDSNYGGPARYISSFKLQDADGATLLVFHDVVWGCVSDKTADAIERGWAFLLGECFKPFIEQGKHPERPQSVSS